MLQAEGGLNNQLCFAGISFKHQLKIFHNVLQGEPDRAQSLLRLTDGDGGSAATGDDCQRHPRYVGELRMIN